MQTFGSSPQQRRIVLELPSNEAVRSAVEAGAGLAVMSSLVARSSIRADALVQLPFVLPKRPFYVLSHRQLYQSRATKAMLSLLFGPEREHRSTDTPPTSDK